MSTSLDVMLKRFDKPDETRVFEKGRFEVVHMGGMTIGRATYEPGWKWSVHVGAKLGRAMCEVEHVGMVVSGCATAAMRDGRVIEMRAGDVSDWRRNVVACERKRNKALAVRLLAKGAAVLVRDSHRLRALFGKPVSSTIR
jgi:hypothetical protein